MSDLETRSEIRRPAKNRAWMWFFAVVIVLAGAAAGINWAYNVKQQLSPSQLADAMKLWKEKGPRDYDLRIEKSTSSANSDGKAKLEVIESKIRGGKVLFASLDGQPMEARLLPNYDMPAWFGFIEEFLANDAKPNAPRTFRAAVFDPTTGAILNFRRRKSGTHERQEITIRVSAPAPRTAGDGSLLEPQDRK